MNSEIVTESGLKYIKIQEGNGRKPLVGETICAHYEIFFGPGTATSNYDQENDKYIDEIYDSTYDKNNPFSGPVEFIIGKYTPKDHMYDKKDSIVGLDEAFLDMCPGEKRKLTIPASLAYGLEGASSFHTFHGFRTAPNATIICNVELVEIK
jgi:FKBP-type peptidyl-prolyl cis-trans isomerase